MQSFAGISGAVSFYSEFIKRKRAIEYRSELIKTARSSRSVIEIDVGSFTDVRSTVGVGSGRIGNELRRNWTVPSARWKPIRAQDCDGNWEEDVSCKPQTKTSPSVLPYVGVTCLGAILFGYHLGVVNGALEYVAKDLGIADNAVGLRGWVVSTALAGAALGSFTGGTLADKFGRRKTFMLNALPLGVGALLCATAQSVKAMIIGRLLAGFGIGISSALVPLYISEISPTEIRGTLGSVNQLFIGVGILLALVAGFPLSGNPTWWRTMFGLAVVPAAMMALGMIFCPESPRWLFQQGKFSEAETASKSLWGKEKVAIVMQDLRATAQGSAEKDAVWLDLCIDQTRILKFILIMYCFVDLFRPLIELYMVVSVGAALYLFQQLAGKSAVVYYSTMVFRSAGVTSDILASALVGAANVFGTVVASFLMDRQGRKNLLISSFLGMGASMLLLSAALTWKLLAPYDGTLAVFGMVLYVLSYALGVGPVPALLLPEIFPSRIRAKAVSSSQTVHWISNFMIGLCFLSMVDKLGIGRVYLGFATACCVAALYTVGNVIETKGRSLEEIEIAFTSAA